MVVQYRCNWDFLHCNCFWTARQKFQTSITVCNRIQCFAFFELPPAVVWNWKAESNLESGDLRIVQVCGCKCLVIWSKDISDYTVFLTGSFSTSFQFKWRWKQWTFSQNCSYRTLSGGMLKKISRLHFICSTNNLMLYTSMSILGQFEILSVSPF